MPAHIARAAAESHTLSLAESPLSMRTPPSPSTSGSRASHWEPASRHTLCWESSGTSKALGALSPGHFFISRVFRFFFVKVCSLAQDFAVRFSFLQMANIIGIGWELVITRFFPFLFTVSSMKY